MLYSAFRPRVVERITNNNKPLRHSSPLSERGLFNSYYRSYSVTLHTVQLENIQIEKQTYQAWDSCWRVETDTMFFSAVDAVIWAYFGGVTFRSLVELMLIT